MRKIPLSTIVFAGLLYFSLPVLAQNDSSRLDAGFLKLNKNLTQSVRIRGEDLEKMPYTNLGDAIGAWLFGAYSNRNTLVFIVDGNILSDVNAYSVYDIEEVVYVQNAAALLNTAYSQQQVVLVTTRKKAGGKSGFTLASQTGPVTRDFPNTGSGKSQHSATRWYQQYYAGFHKDLDKLSLGLTAGFQRDVFPASTSLPFQMANPDKLNRWRFNGSLAWRPGKQHTISLQLNYTPQSKNSAWYQYYLRDSTDQSSRAHSKYIAPVLRWQADLTNGWKNELQLTYVSAPGKTDYLFKEYGPAIAGIQRSGLTADQDIRHFQVRDRLSWEGRAGDWRIEPSLYTSYEHLSWEYNSKTAAWVGANPVGSTTTQKGKSDLYMLTPSVQFNYRNALSIVGGALVNASHEVRAHTNRVFPFVSAAADLLRWNRPDNPAGLKIFGSWAERTNVTISDWGLTDLSDGPNVFTVPALTGGSFPGAIIYNGPPGFTSVPGLPSRSWSWATGIQFSACKERLTVSYQFERRNFTASEFDMSPVNPPLIPVFFYPDLHSSSHFLQVRTKMIARDGFEWQSGISAAIITTHYALPYMHVMAPITGDMTPAHPSWTGGWTNQFRLGQFVAGLWLQYHFGEDNGPLAANRMRYNSFLLQDLYAGYRLTLPGSNNLEIYANCRNLYQNDKSDLTDRRRYYGIGGKLGF